MPMSSGTWTGTARDAFQYTAEVSLNVTVDSNTLSGTITVSPNIPGAPVYAANIQGSISGNQVSVWENPPSATSFSGIWTDTPNSHTGALQSMYGTISPSSSPAADVSGGGTIMLFFRG